MSARYAIHLVLTLLALLAPAVRSQVIYDQVSEHNHIRVIDRQGYRILSFDGSAETRMWIPNPLLGHFEYTDYFHMAWIWSPKMTNVLMIGLGGGSIQRSFQHYYPEVRVDTVEIDPKVVEVAKDYFFVRESSKFHIHVMDGRKFIEKTKRKFDAIFLDAYTSNPQGSFIPRQLATQEFFALCKTRLNPEGVVIYNVMGSLSEPGSSVLGTVFRTLKAEFAHVHIFVVSESRNVMLVASNSEAPMTWNVVQQRAAMLVRQGRVTLPGFQLRALAFRDFVPPSALRSPVLKEGPGGAKSE